MFPSSPAYQFEILPPVEEAIRKLHAIVSNADTEGYSIVYGVGATNLLFMTITAMSKNIIDVSNYSYAQLASYVNYILQSVAN